jgi:hypothetical protein
VLLALFGLAIWQRGSLARNRQTGKNVAESPLIERSSPWLKLASTTYCDEVGRMMLLLSHESVLGGSKGEDCHCRPPPHGTDRLRT